MNEFHIIKKTIPLLAVVFLLASACGSSKEIQDTPTEEPQQDEVQEESNDTTEELSEAEKERREELVNLYKEELRQQYQAKANGVTTYYILAQQQFYQGEHENAFYLINRAAKAKETADVLALKGSIYLALGETEKFVEYWKRAFEMDDNMPVPIAPFVTRELQKQGLVDDNFERIF